MTETEKTTDIEKIKELFEYEMTEVRLMLEGQFASVSGKDIRGTDEPLVDETKLTVNKVTIQNAEPVGIEMKLPDIPGIPESDLKNGITKEGFSAETEISLNEVKPVPAVSINAVEVTPFEGKIVSADIQIPEKTQDITIEAPAISVLEVQMKEISTDNIKAEIPQNTISVPVPDMNMPAVSLTAQADEQIRRTMISEETGALLNEVKPVSAVSINAVEVTPFEGKIVSADIQIPEKAQDITVEAPAIAIPEAVIPVSAVNIIPEKAQDITVEAPAIAIPEAVIPVSAVNINAVEVAPFEGGIVSADIQIPENTQDIAIESPAVTVADVQKPDIKFQAAAVKPAEKPAISIPEPPEVPKFVIEDNHEETKAIQERLEKMVIEDFADVMAIKPVVLETGTVKQVAVPDSVPVFKAPEKTVTQYPESLKKAEKALAESKTYYTVDDL